MLARTPPCSGARRSRAELVGVIANVMTATHVLTPAAGRFTPAFVADFVEEAGYLALSVAYASTLALMFQSPRWTPMLRRFAPIGQMALTWYLSQTLVALWLFYGFMPGLHSDGTCGRLRSAGDVCVWFAHSGVTRVRLVASLSIRTCGVGVAFASPTGRYSPSSGSIGREGRS